MLIYELSGNYNLNSMFGNRPCHFIQQVLGSREIRCDYFISFIDKRKIKGNRGKGVWIDA